MRRRDFMKIVGGAAAGWPLAARAQQPARMRRIGILAGGLAADDPEWQVRSTAFVQALAHLGWIDGRNVRIDFRFGLSDPERRRQSAAELVALGPDVLLAGGGSAVQALQQATRTVPIVFANVVDPVGEGFVASLVRPGGNATGFMSVEFGVSGKWLELLKQIAPRVARVAVLRNATTTEIAQFAAIQAVAPSFGVEVIPIIARDAGELENKIMEFARGPNSGLIAPNPGTTQSLRDRIIALAARNRLPAVYPFRGYVTAGGLISYGIDQAERYRLAAGYVDRILKGEKPADLPVQAPTKYETVLNMKTAKALELQVPDVVRLRADEIIE
jgi:putative tryptophan/tyrosine transport system substrate-binding protein